MVICKEGGAECCIRAFPRDVLRPLADYFNVHNTFQLLVAGADIASPTSILVGDYQLFAGGNQLYGTQQTLSHTVPGDDLSFYPLNTFSWPALAAARIASIVPVPDAVAKPLLAAAYSNASAVAKSTPCSACHAGLNPYANAQLYNVTLTEPFPLQLAPPLFVNSDAYSASSSSITDCTFSGSGSNLGRFKSSGGSITGTVFRNTLSQNLEIEPLQNWLEGMLGIHNVTVANNVFYGTGSSPIHTFGAADVEIRNNTYVPGADDLATGAGTGSTF